MSVGMVTADLKLVLLTPPSCSRGWITVRARERGRDEAGLRQRGRVFVTSLFSTLMHEEPSLSQSRRLQEDHHVLLLSSSVELVWASWGRSGRWDGRKAS